MVASCHLSHLVRTFSDLGSVNITQKKKLPSYAKAERLRQNGAYPGPCRFHRTSAVPRNCGPGEPAPRTPPAASRAQPACLRPGLCRPDKPGGNHSSHVIQLWPSSDPVLLGFGDVGGGVGVTEICRQLRAGIPGVACWGQGRRGPCRSREAVGSG